MRARHIAMALGGALALAAANPVSAAESWSEKTMKPLMATSLDAGGAHIVSYFQSADRACRLTVMIADEIGETGSAPTRVQMIVEPGRAAYVDGADGKSTRFTCLYSAAAMNVVRTERMAMAPER